MLRTTNNRDREPETNSQQVCQESPSVSNCPANPPDLLSPKRKYRSQERHSIFRRCLLKGRPLPCSQRAKVLGSTLT